HLPVENLLTPDYVRRLLWEPPDPEADDLVELVAARLTGLGARDWQVGLAAELLTEAIRSPDPLPGQGDGDADGEGSTSSAADSSSMRGNNVSRSTTGA
ncbi:MAG: hypothetical protein HOQ22_06010, partial [Nocardioidaceae bacterium]|nr:hypothetical protein [Nocardioidaceae bacterium]